MWVIFSLAITYNKSTNQKQETDILHIISKQKPKKALLSWHASRLLAEVAFKTYY